MGITAGPATRACQRVGAALFATIALSGSLWAVAHVAEWLSRGRLFLDDRLSMLWLMFILGHGATQFRRAPSERDAIAMLGRAVAMCVSLGILTFWGAVALALDADWWSAIVCGSAIPGLATGFVIAVVARHRLVPPPREPEDPAARHRLARAALSLRLLAPATIALLWIVVPRREPAATVHLVILSACVAGFLLWLARGVAYGRYVLGAAALAGVYCMMAALFAILGVLGLVGGAHLSLVLRAFLLLFGAANLYAIVAVFAAVGSEPRAHKAA